MSLQSVLLCSLFGIGGSPDGHGPDGNQLPVALIEGLGKHHHPVSTKVPEAQHFFDQGLILLYAFNHDEAARHYAGFTLGNVSVRMMDVHCTADGKALFDRAMLEALHVQRGNL